MWDHFTKIGIIDGKEKAKCNHYGQEYVCGDIKVGNSSMACHLPRCEVMKWEKMEIWEIW